MTAARLGGDHRLRRDFEEVVQCEIVKGPHHILPRRHFLPAARRAVFVVQQQEPESGVGFRIGEDLRDDEVVEGGVVAGVLAHVQELRPGVQGPGAGGARDEVVAVVGSCRRRGCRRILVVMLRGVEYFGPSWKGLTAPSIRRFTTLLVKGSS